MITAAGDLIVVLGRIIEAADNPRRVRELASGAIKIARHEREQLAALLGDAQDLKAFMERVERDAANLEAARDWAFRQVAENQVEIDRLKARLNVVPVGAAK